MADIDGTIDGIIVRAVIAGREYLRLPRLWLRSLRHAPLTRAGLILPDPAGEEISRIQAGDAVSLVFGYRNGLPATWSGTVEWVRPGSQHQTELGIVGAEKAFGTRFTQSFVDEAPDAILRWALAQAGIEAGRLDSPGVVLPRFSVANETLWALSEKLELSCQRAFGLDASAWCLWMDAKGRAHWGDFDDPEQTTVYTVATGGNLISHTPATDTAGLSEVETWLVPGLLHSQVFRLVDTRRGVNDEFRALSVRHEVDSGRARTFIQYGSEHDRW